MSQANRILLLIAAGTLMLACALLYLVGSARLVRMAEPDRGYAPVGTNLSPVTYWSTQRPFVDLFLTSREWVPRCRFYDDPARPDPGCTADNTNDTGEAPFIDLDEHGWVRSLPQGNDGRTFTYVLTTVRGDHPAGEYVVLYEGEGRLEYSQRASKIEGTSSPGRDVIWVEGHIGLEIVETDPNQTGNYIRNIRIVPIESEATYQRGPFNPVFLERLAPFTALRFMDWMRTNDSDQGDWGDRPQLRDARYSTEKGVPLETMIALSNTVGADPWFNMPHLANDAYVTNFAALTKKELRPDLDVIVEYSNEVWNKSFEQAVWAEERAVRAWPFAEGERNEKLYSWYGRRSVEICRIWKEVWGEERERVKCVLASQSVNPWISEQILACRHARLVRPCGGQEISYLAIAPYFGARLGDPEHAETLERWSRGLDGGVDRLFDEIRTGRGLRTFRQGHLNPVYDDMREQAAVARRNGLTLVAYEGGQHLSPNGPVRQNEPVTTLFNAANRDPAMGELYTAYLISWRNGGGGLFMHFSDVRRADPNGSWGALEDVALPDTPKYRALLDFIENESCKETFCVEE